MRTLALVGVALMACGGRAHRTEGSDASVGGSAGTGGSAGMGGSSGATSGTGGSSGGMLGDAGTAGDASIPFDDFDHASDPSAPPPAFFWGTHIGNWFVTTRSGFDGDATIDTIEPPRGDSTKACHVRGPEYAAGVDLWAQLDHPRNNPVDLAGYSGLAFWARLSSAGAKLVVALNDGSVSLEADDDFTALPSGTFAASQEWQYFVLPLGDPARLHAVVSIDFVVLFGGDGLDLWIDDLMLLCSGECP